MKVKCINNKASSLSEKALGIVGTKDTVLSISVGRDYIVYSICLWKGVLQYLIMGEENLPSWYPSELFQVVDKQIPFEFYYDFYEGESLEAIWGYREIVFDESHYDNLLERKDSAIKDFLYRKKEIDLPIQYPTNTCNPEANVKNAMKNHSMGAIKDAIKQWEGNK